MNATLFQEHELVSRRVKIGNEWQTKTFPVVGGRLRIQRACIFGSLSDKESLAAFVPYLAGILLVVLWNANTAWPLAYLFLKAGPQGMPVGWALDYWKSAPVLTGFLCTAALTFFFLKSSRFEQE